MTHRAPLPYSWRQLANILFSGVLWIALAVAGGAPLTAHEMGTIQVEVALRAGGRWEAAVAIDEEHVPAAGAGEATAGGAGTRTSHKPIAGMTPALEARLGAFLRALAAGAAPAFDGRRVRPERIAVEEPAPSNDPFAPAPRPTLRLSGEIPAGARAFTWSQPLAVGRYPLALSNEGDAAPARQWLQDGAASASFPVATHVAPPSRREVVRQYLALGFTHILPLGLDHILFVLGLFLLSDRWKPLLLQVSAFTVAHTLTLGLTVYGVVGLPSRVVEPLIALSIAYVAVENVIAPVLKPWRLALVFGFGLLHGMGFAGVLSELGLPGSELLTAVLAFNAGVEAGQLAVIALAFLALGLPWRAAPWYRRRITVPASLAIAAVGLYWSVERVLS